MRKKKSVLKKAAVLILLVIYVSALITVPAFGGGGGGGGAKEWTQLDRLAEVAAKYKEQYDAYAAQFKQWMNQLEDIKGLTSELMTGAGSVMEMVNSVMSSYDSIQGTLQQLANLDESVFKNIFSATGGRDFDAVRGMFTGEGKEKWADFPTALWEISERLEKESKNVLETLGVDAENLKTRSELTEQLIKKAADAKQRDKIAMAGNQIIGAMLAETQAMNKVMIDMEAHILKVEAEAQAAEDAARAVQQDDISKWKEPEEVNVEFDWGNSRRR